MENEPCGGGAPPYRNNFIGRASSGRNRNPPAKNGPPALCLLADLLETSASHLITLLSALSHIPSGKDPHMPPKF